MLSSVFLGYAAVHLGLWLWGWRLWATHGRPVPLALVLVSGTLLSYDNFRIGIGRFVGAGDMLHALSVPAFAWHWSMLPLLVIAAGSLARAAGLAWAQPRVVMGAFCLTAVGLSALDIPKIAGIELHVACLADTVRYTTSVPATQLCNPADAPVSHSTGAALVAILTNVVLLGVGIALWWQRRWPWLAAGAGAMFVAAGAFAGSPWSLPIANLGEICLTLALIVTCVHFARAAPSRVGADARPTAPESR